MKILIDDQFFSQQIYGGISRYHYELYNNLNKLDGVKCEISLLFSHNEYVKHLFAQNRLRRFLFKSKKITRKCNRIYSSYKIAEGDFDIFHPTYYNGYFLKYLKKKPFVITVYDLIPELFPNQVNDPFLIEQKKKLIEKSAAIIAISSNTKDDLLRFYNIPEKKVHVIHLGNSLPNSSSNIPNQKKQNRYILFVGERSSYKNFTFLMNSIAELIIKHNLKVICAGGRGFTATEQKQFLDLKISDRITQVSASETELNDLYRNAMFFIFPSLYEGFGIPVLEAFYNQCPIICSDRGSLPEVAGEAAIYINPESTRDIQNKVEYAILNPMNLEHYTRRGKERLNLFSWLKNAEMTLEVYKSVL